MSTKRTAVTDEHEPKRARTDDAVVAVATTDVAQQQQQEFLFVQVHDGTTYRLDAHKLRTQAPASYFTKLMTNNAGATQEGAIALGLPKWFVEAVADWAQPMGTPYVFFGNMPDVIAAKVLLRTTWAAADGADIPLTSGVASEYLKLVRTPAQIRADQKAAEMQRFLDDIRYFEDCNGSGKTVACVLRRADETVKSTGRECEALITLLSANMLKQPRGSKKCETIVSNLETKAIGCLASSSAQHRASSAIIYIAANVYAHLVENVLKSLLDLHSSTAVTITDKKGTTNTVITYITDLPFQYSDLKRRSTVSIFTENAAECATFHIKFPKK